MIVDKNNNEIPYITVLPDGRWEMIFDNSKISCFADCEQLFYYKYVMNIRPKVQNAFAMNIGSWWSKTMQYYYTALKNKDLTKSLAIELGINAWRELDMERLKTVKTKMYEKFGGPQGAALMVSQYFDATFQQDQHWNIVSIEQGYGLNREIKIAESDKVVIYYVILPDLTIVDQNHFYPVDHKTKDYIKSNIVHQYKPHTQTAGYVYSTQQISRQLGLSSTVIDRCVISASARNLPSDKPRDGIKKPRFRRVLATYSPAELEEWRTKTLHRAERLRHCIETNEWGWNDRACHLYAGCSFRPIDSVPAGARPFIIQASYEKQAAWIPYEVDEEEEEENGIV